MDQQITQDKARPDFRATAYTLMMPALKVCQDLYAGTLAVRAACTSYLPMNPQEPKPDYAARVLRTVVLPAFKRTITLALGLVFDKDPTLKDLPTNIEEELQNADLTGKPIGLFARDALKAALRDGHSFIYVDMPPSIETTTTLAAEVTQLDEQTSGMRPYWVLYQKDQAVNWRFSNVNGRLVLQQVTFREHGCEPDGPFGEKTVVRYRVLNPGRVRVYEIDEHNVPQEKQDQLTFLKYIPVFPVYGGEELAPFESAPPLLDLALMNVQHTQLSSDLHSILHVANVPILWARDRNLAAPFLAVGPSVLVDLIGEHSEIGYAEHEGKAIGKAQEEITAVEKRMAVAGFQLLAEQTSGPITATGEIKDAAESDSELALAVKSLSGALAQGLQAHADYTRTALQKTGSIELNVEYARLVLSVEEMRLLKEMVENQSLSTETMLNLFNRAGKFGPDFDVDAEMARIFGADADKTEIEKAAAKDPSRDEDPNLTDPAAE